MLTDCKFGTYAVWGGYGVPLPVLVVLLDRADAYGQERYRARPVGMPDHPAVVVAADNLRPARGSEENACTAAEGAARLDGREVLP